MQCSESFVSYLKFYAAFQGYSTFMTSSMENASLTLDVPVTLIFSGFSLNRFLYAGICFHFGFDGVWLSQRGSLWLKPSSAPTLQPGYRWGLVGFHRNVLSFTFSGSVVLCVICRHFLAKCGLCHEVRTIVWA